jgi:hypothetical protein
MPCTGVWTAAELPYTNFHDRVFSVQVFPGREIRRHQIQACLQKPGDIHRSRSFGRPGAVYKNQRVIEPYIGGGHLKKAVAS